MRRTVSVDLQRPTRVEEENRVHNCARRKGRESRETRVFLYLFIPCEVEVEEQAKPPREQQADACRSLGKRHDTYVDEA